jgi:hypothetical protein
VAAIGEADARGDIAELYADIRATLGVPVVNLVWRHLASIDGALPWAWQAVRPAYRSGAVSHHAERLKAGLVLPALEPVPAEVLSCLGLAPAQQLSIRQVLDSYDRSNPMNWLALSALLLAGDGPSTPALEPRGGRAANDASMASGRCLANRRGTRRRHRPTRAGSGPAASPLLRGAALDFTLPALPALDELDAATRALVLRLNALDAERADSILASMFRHLAHWPAMLALLWAQLSPLAHDGRLQQARLQVTDHGAREARALAAVLRADAPQPVHAPARRRCAISWRGWACHG